MRMKPGLHHPDARLKAARARLLIQDNDDGAGNLWARKAGLACDQM